VLVRENPDYQGMFSDELLKRAGITRKELQKHIVYMRGVLNPQRVDRMMWYFRLFRLGLYAEEELYPLDCIKDQLRSWVEDDDLDDFERAEDEDDLPYNVAVTSALRSFCEISYLKGFTKALNKYNRKAKRDKINIKSVALFVERSRVFSLRVADLSEDYTYSLTSKLKHYMDLDLPEINAIPFEYKRPTALMRLFRLYEVAWENRISDFKRLLPIESPHKVFLETSDPDFVWFDTESNTCSYDKEAMGDCAADSADVHLLSLRERVEREGKEYWLPHIRSSWHVESDGKISQIKGRKNSKVKEEYWPFVLEMLLDPRIEGIRKGSYAHERDFNVTWLSDEEQDEIAEVKPELFHLRDYIKRYKVDDYVLSLLAIKNPIAHDIDGTLLGYVLPAILTDIKRPFEATGKYDFLPLETFVAGFGSESLRRQIKYPQTAIFDFIGLNALTRNVMDVMPDSLYSVIAETSWISPVVRRALKESIHIREENYAKTAIRQALEHRVRQYIEADFRADILVKYSRYKNARDRNLNIKVQENTADFDETRYRLYLPFSALSDVSEDLLLRAERLAILEHVFNDVEIPIGTDYKLVYEDMAQWFEEEGYIDEDKYFEILDDIALEFEND